MKKRGKREIIQEAKDYVLLALTSAPEYAEEYTKGSDDWTEKDRDALSKGSDDWTEKDRDALSDEVQAKVERVERFLLGGRASGEVR